MSDPQIPTLRKGYDSICAAIGVSRATLSQLLRDPAFPVRYFGRTPVMDVEAFRQWLGVKPEPTKPSQEAIKAAVEEYMKAKFGG